jgi:hypothetical protein
MDSSVSEIYGHQEGTAYNGYFACLCYHPLFLFNQFSDLERVLLRRGSYGSAKFFRGDAAFAGPKLLRLLERIGRLRLAEASW